MGSFLREDFEHNADGADHCSVTPSAKPKLAIVLDDLCGASDATLSVEAAKLSDQVTVAILPNGVGGEQCFSKVSWAIRQADGEAIVHMPMEAKNTPLERNGIGVDVPMDENLRRFDHNMTVLEDFKIKPVGFNNHTGSLATSFGEVVHEVMAKAMMDHSDRVTFVLDSKTTADSKMCVEADKFGIPCIERDSPFLDHSLDKADITQALWKSVEMAEKNGSAITIGHPHPQTLEVLRENWDAVQERVDLVNVSSLANACD